MKSQQRKAMPAAAYHRRDVREASTTATKVARAPHLDHLRCSEKLAVASFHLKVEVQQSQRILPVSPHLTTELRV
jgi:hypothetical protein